MHSKNQHYLFIDGLRAVAFLMVLIHHMFYFFDLYPVFQRFYWLCAVIAEGRLGVDLFFIISGFLITGVIIGSNDARSPNIWRFYQRRFFKIYPQYAICLVSCLFFPVFFSQIYAPAGSFYSFEINKLWPYLIFVQNYIFSNPFFEHAWSLAVEEHFYLVYPIIIGLIFKLTAEQHRINMLKLSIGVLVAIVVGYRFVTHMTDPICVVTHASSFQSTFMRIDALMVGCLIKLFQPFLERQSARTAWLLFITGSLAWISLFLRVIPIDRFYVTVAWLGAACFFIVGLSGLRFMNVCLECRPLRWIGKNSYGLYLWHYPLIFLMAPLANVLPSGVLILVYLTAVFFFGAGSTATIEYLSLKFRDRVCP
ncbi:MAG: acyltransferase [Candidatus Omnitrophica bacterium]|nr:acyltransferase [Candidatus Omnitrophota bacterium]